MWSPGGSARAVIHGQRASTSAWATSFLNIARERARRGLMHSRFVKKGARCHQHVCMQSPAPAVRYVCHALCFGGRALRCHYRCPVPFRSRSLFLGCVCASYIRECMELAQSLGLAQARGPPNPHGGVFRVLETPVRFPLLRSALQQATGGIQCHAVAARWLAYIRHPCRSCVGRAEVRCVLNKSSRSFIWCYCLFLLLVRAAAVAFHAPLI